MSNTRRRYYRTGRKTLRDGKGHGWNWSTPSWWNRLMHTKRRRVEVRRVMARFMRDPGAADGLIWPIDRKPHWYFW
jgi:hypothetical protein